MGYLSKDDQLSHKDISSTISLAALFVIPEPGNSLNAPYQRMAFKKKVVHYTLEYYTAETDNNTLKFSGKWMEQKNIILSEVTQTQKDSSHMYCLKSGF